MVKQKLCTIICIVSVLSAWVIGALPTSTSPSPGIRVSTSSVQQKPKLVATVTVDAAVSGATTNTWTTAKTNFVRIPVEWSNIALSFYGFGDGSGAGDPDGATFSYDVYVCDVFGGWEAVVTGSTGTIGGMQLSHFPSTGTAVSTTLLTSYSWCDDLNEGTKKTTSTIAYSDYESTNGLAKTKFDRNSAYGIYVQMYDMTGQSVTSITCVMNGFNQ